MLPSLEPDRVEAAAHPDRRGEPRACHRLARGDSTTVASVPRRRPGDSNAGGSGGGGGWRRGAAGGASGGAAGLGRRRRRGVGRAAPAHRLGGGRRRRRPRARGHRQHGGRKQAARARTRESTSSTFVTRASHDAIYARRTDTSTAVADEPNPSASETAACRQGPGGHPRRVVPALPRARAAGVADLRAAVRPGVAGEVVRRCRRSSRPSWPPARPRRWPSWRATPRPSGSALADAYARNADADTIARLQRENQQRLEEIAARIADGAGPVHALGAGRARHAGVRAGVRHRRAVDGRRADHRRRRPADRRPHRMGRSLDAAARAAGPAAGGDRPGRRPDRDRPWCCG